MSRRLIYTILSSSQVATPKNVKFSPKKALRRNRASLPFLFAFFSEFGHVGTGDMTND